jgi:hypothetical protein
LRAKGPGTLLEKAVNNATAYPRAANGIFDSFVQ